MSIKPENLKGGEKVGKVGNLGRGNNTVLTLLGFLFASYMLDLELKK